MTLMTNDPDYSDDSDDDSDDGSGDDYDDNDSSRKRKRKQTGNRASSSKGITTIDQYIGSGTNLWKSFF